MKRILPIIEALSQHYNGQRQVGHTWALVNGAKNLDCACTIIAANLREGEIIAREVPNATVLSIESITSGQLRNKRQPLLIDHHALAELLGRASHELHRLDSDNATLSSELRIAREALDERERQNVTLRRELQEARETGEVQA